MGYRNFDLAIYCTVRDVENIAINPEFDKDFDPIEKHLQVDKVYLESYRVGHLIEREKLLKVKKIFSQKGIKTSGGITTNCAGVEFTSFCYSNPEHREQLKQIVRFTAELFDEIILDDFYFTNCKCPS